MAPTADQTPANQAPKPENPPAESSKDEERREDDVSHDEDEDEHDLSQHETGCPPQDPITPAVHKRRKATKHIMIQSPTDNIFSPISQKLLGKKKTDPTRELPRF